ncbi:MAG: hybrid sensor histidine kinase/response regulator, partial [Anaerolineae bacterium]
AMGAFLRLMVLSARERHLARRRLREAHDLLRTVIDNIPDSIYVKDAKGRKVLANRADLAYIGAASELEVLDKTDAELRGIELSAQSDAHDQMVLREGRPVIEQEELGRRPDGSLSWGLTTKIPIRDAEGRVTGLVGVSRDITERKRAEEQLRERERRYRSILHTALDGFWLVDTQGRLLEVNEAYCQMSGYSRDELLSMHVPDLEIIETEGEMAAHMQALMVKGKDRFETRHRRKDGSILNAEVALSYNPMDGGRIVTVLRDITERQIAEEQLRESERRYRNILQTAMDGFCLVDTQGRLLEVNEAYCQMTGYSRDELLGMSVPDLEMIESADEMAARMQTLLEHGRDRFETQHRRKDGSILDVEVALSYSPMDGGRTVAILRDVTERKIADQALAQSHKMEAVGQLAGGIAHDLNNMLSVINGYSQMALEVLPPTDQLYKDIGEIKNAGDRSARLTRQLLTFARRQAIAPRVLDLNTTTEEMLSMLRRLVGENVKLVWEPGTGLWPVKIDPSQFDQILANLVVNARDAITGVGTVTIATANAELSEEYCRAHIESQPGPYVMIDVTDDGTGMDEDVLEHLFEPFFTTKPVGQGTGLGLATVYGITKQNGGSIDVSSMPGMGTTFRIYIPRHIAAADTAALDPELAEAPRGSETVLVVEDEVALLQLVRRILEQLGYTVLSADTPHEALELAARYEGQIDLLLTDVVMPGMGGRQLQQALATTHPTLRWLFMSGYTAGALSQQGVLDSDPHLLQKPFSRAQLAQYVRVTLDET